MPRYSRIPAILRTKRPGNPDVITPATPRLWNAKRRIKQSHGLTLKQYLAYKADPHSETWRTQVSEDVAAFIDVNTSDLPQNIELRDHKLLPEEKATVLKYPSRFFSRPHNVPVQQRKQVYFPNFQVALIRRPHISPYFATFDVPLWFNKLDMKSYLLQLYNVDVVHVRSYTKQPTVARRHNPNPKLRGALYRPPSTKRMNVQLVEAFEWPKEVTDFTDFDKEEYWRSSKAHVDITEKESAKEILVNKPDQLHRNTIAKQARDLLAGKTKWAPTWQHFDADKKVMQGIADVLPKTPQNKKKKKQTQMQDKTPTTMTTERTRLGREILERRLPVVEEEARL